MKRSFGALLILLSVTALAQEPYFEYWAACPLQPRSNLKEPSLKVWSKVAQKVQIEYDAVSLQQDVMKDKMISITLPWLKHKTVQRGGVHVRSLDSIPLNAMLTIGPEEYFEGSVCLPTQALGKCYRIASYSKLASIENAATSLAPMFVIQGTQENTNVTIEFPVPSGLPPISVLLGTNETYFIDCSKPDVNIDPTGTSVKADKPVAVFAAHPRVMIPLVPVDAIDENRLHGVANCLVEQMLPIESWGTIHMVVASPLRAADYFRIIANEDSTIVSIDGAPTAIVNAGEFFETQLTGPHEIAGSKPIMVVEYTQAGSGGSGSYPGNGNSAMMVVAPTTSYFAASNFLGSFSNYSSAMTNDTLVGSISKSVLIIIAPMEYAGSVELGGALIGAINFVPMPKSINNPILYGYFVDLANPPSNFHTIRYSSPPPNPNTLYGCVNQQDGERDEESLYAIGYRPNKLFPQASMTALVSFDTLVCDSERTKSVSITNIGSAPLVISQATLSGSTEFSILSPSFPDTIPPGSSHSLLLRFTSNVAGSYNGTITFTTNENDCNVAQLVRSMALTARKERAGSTASPRTIDFGIVSCTDLERTIEVRNTGTVDVFVTDKLFSDSVALSLESPALPDRIKPGETHSYIIRLRSATIPVGAFAGSLELKVAPCNQTLSVAFSATRKELEAALDPSAIDFGITAIGKRRSSKVTFQNKSAFGIRLQRADFNPNPFDGIVSTSLPKELQSGETADILFSCVAKDPIFYDGRICLSIDSPCTRELCIPVSIEGASTCLTPQATAATRGKKPGDEVIIPIVVDPSTKLADAKNIEIVVKYDSELLRYDKISGDSISNVHSSDGELSFTITPIAPLSFPTATIAELHMQALLATKVRGEIAVTSSLFTLSSGEVISGENCPSQFSLDSSCILPSELKPRSQATLEGIYPNPSSTKAMLVIAAKNSPQVHVEIFDRLGRHVEVVYHAELTDGNNEIMINTDQYAAGFYLCRMTHNNVSTTRAFNVER